MTTRSDYENGKSFDNEAASEDDLDPSTGKQVIAALKLLSWHARRTLVFVPLFGVVFLLIGFMWFQGFRQEASLNTQAEQLRVLLDQPAPQPEMLMSEARGWDTAYHVVLQNRVARPEDSDLVASVIDAAADAGLVLTETGTTLDGVATIENESYTATPVLISAIGTIESIETYLQMLETSRFASFGIEAATVEEGLVGYQLSLRGLFYSLPEDFGDDGEVVDSSPDVTPVVPVDMQVVSENGGAK